MATHPWQESNVLNRYRDGEFGGRDHPIVAYPWIEAQDYPEIRRIMIDGDHWPDDYERWRNEAERAIERLSVEGVELVRTRLDPAAFAEWCRVHDYPTDSGARLAFAEQVALGHV